MTVSQLIDQLQHIPRDKEVVLLVADIVEGKNVEFPIDKVRFEKGKVQVYTYNLLFN